MITTTPMAASDSELEAESEDDLLLMEEMRLTWDLGACRRLDAFTGSCIGDDVSCKLTKAIRFVALQAGGGGRDWHTWAKWWAASMTSVGADVVSLSECAIPTPAAIEAARRGFLDGGWLALIHSTTKSESCRATGVVIAIRSSYAGTWQAPARDRHGRGVAGNFTSAEGIVVRVAGLYGPSGGSLPGADSCRLWLEKERDTVAFMAEQREAAAKHGWVLVALGDLNSVANIELDTWGGTHTARANCLAVAMQEEGLTDTFRSAHPETRAFTYFHDDSSASRLDQVWYWAPPDADVLVCNAATIWGWARKADHEPSVADLSLSLPAAALVAAPAACQWRSIVRMLDEGKEEVLKKQVLEEIAKEGLCSCSGWWALAPDERRPAASYCDAPSRVNWPTRRS